MTRSTTISSANSNPESSRSSRDGERESSSRSLRSLRNGVGNDGKGPGGERASSDLLTGSDTRSGTGSLYVNGAGKIGAGAGRARGVAEGARGRRLRCRDVCPWEPHREWRNWDRRGMLRLNSRVRRWRACSRARWQSVGGGSKRWRSVSWVGRRRRQRRQNWWMLGSGFVRGRASRWMRDRHGGVAGGGVSRRTSR